MKMICFSVETRRSARSGLNLTKLQIHSVDEVDVSDDESAGDETAICLGWVGKR
jgi:hypothetical protein